MAKYRVDTPSGVAYEVEGPEGASENDLIRVVMAQYPESVKPAKPSTNRTVGESFTDLGASLAAGTGKALQFPGQVLKLAGATGIGEALEKPGEALAEWGEGLKSKGLKAREALRSERMSAAEKDGMLAEYATAIKETITDPGLLLSFLTEQLPQLVGPAGAAKITTKLGMAGVEGLAAGAAKEAAAKALGEKATKAAIGTGAVMQGTDVGSETYDQALKLLEKQYPNMPPEKRQEIALAKARMAALEGAGISLVSQKLPGGSAIEKRMAGLPGAGRIKSALGEAASESIEEGGGRFATNLGLNEIDPTVSLTKGVGSAAGLGAVGGLGMGAALGAHRAPEEAKPAADTPPGTPGAPGVDLIDAKAAERQAKDTPPAAEAPPANESADTANVPPPTVRGADVPETVLTKGKLVAAGIVPKSKLHKALDGKDVSNLDDLTAIYAAIDTALSNPKISSKVAEKINAFKQTLPQQPAAKESVETGVPNGTGETVTPPSGESASVAGESGAGSTPGGTGGIEPSGLVPTQPPAGDINVGEGSAPTTVNEAAPPTETPAPPAETPPAAAGIDAIESQYNEQKELHKPVAEALSAFTAASDIVAKLRKQLENARKNNKGDTRGNNREQKLKQQYGEAVAKADAAWKVFEGLRDGVAAKNAGEEITAPPVETPPTEAPAPLQETPTEGVEQLIAEREALRTSKGKVPAPRSKARAKWDALTVRIEELQQPRTTEGTALDTAAKPELPEAATPGGYVVHGNEVFLPTQEHVDKIQGRIDALEEEIKNSQLVAKMANKSVKGGINKLATRVEQIALAKKRVDIQKEIAGLKAVLKTLNGLIDKQTDTHTGGKRRNMRASATAVAALNATAANPNAPKPKGKRGRPTNVVDETEGKEHIETDSELEQEYATMLKQSAGVLNNPKSTKDRRQANIQWLFDVINHTGEGEDPNIPESIRKAAREIILERAKPSDLTDEQMAQARKFTDNTDESTTDWSKYIYAQGRGYMGQPNSQEVEQIILDGGSAQDVLKFIAEKGSNLLYRRLAKFMMRLPVRVTVRIGKPKGAPGIAHFQEDTGEIVINVRGDSEYAFMHEFVHAATVYAINRKTPAARKLIKLFQEYSKQQTSDAYGFTDAKEFMSEALTNRDFQNELRAMHKGSIWERLVNYVREIFGMPPQYNHAFEQLLSITGQMSRENAANYGYAEQGTKTPLLSAQDIAVANANNAVGERKQSGLAERMWKESGNKPALWLGIKVADFTKGIDQQPGEAFGKKIRSAGGRLKPPVLLAHALDAMRVARSVLETGGLFKQGDGLTVAGKLQYGTNEDGSPRYISYRTILHDIAGYAKQMGISAKEYMKVAGELIYGHREFEIRAKDRQYLQDIQNIQNNPNISQSRKTRSIAVIQAKIVGTYLLSDTEIDNAERQFNANPYVKEIAKQLDHIRFNMIDAMVATRRISEATAQIYKDATGYMPVKRIMKYEEKYGTIGRNRGAAAMRAMQKYKGDETHQTTNPIENFVALTEWMTSESLKNDATLRGLRTMELLGSAKRIPTNEIGDAPGKAIAAYKDGVKVWYHVEDPNLAVAFSLADPVVSNVIKAMQKVSHVLRAGVTSAPPFALKQVADDIYRAYTNSGVERPLQLVERILTGFPRLWLDEWKGIKQDKVKELEQRGIVGTFDFQSGGNLRNIMQEAGFEKRGLGATIMHYMEAGAKASDLAVRKAIYEQTIEETKTAQNPEGDTILATHRAREIINFSRRGSAKMMGQMISVIPFFNAYAQGMNKLVDSANGRNLGTMSRNAARRQFMQRMATLTALGLTYALMMVGDEDYEKQEDNVRDNNWILPWGKHLGFTPAIPVPAEMAFFFKAIPERVVRYYKLQGTPEEQQAVDVLGNLVRRGFDVFSSPNVMAQATRPFLENLINYSFFLGRPLESQSQQQMEPFMRFGTGTSEVSKKLAEGLQRGREATGLDLLGVSPIKIDNALRGIFGTTGGIMLSIGDMMLNPDKTDRPLHQQLGAQITGVSTFMKDGIGSRYLSEIYNLEKEATQAHNTYNKLKEYDPIKAGEFLERNIGVFSIYDAVHQTMKSIHDMNKQAMLLDKMKDVPPADRREYLNMVKINSNQIAQVVYMMRKAARDNQAYYSM